MVNNDSKICPFCSREIKAKAIKCKHCMADLTLDKGKPFTNKAVQNLEETDFNKMEAIKSESLVDNSIKGDKTQKTQDNNRTINDESAEKSSSNSQKSGIKSIEEKALEERVFVVEKINFIEYVAWAYLILSFIGGIYIWDEMSWYWGGIAVAVAFALILQAVIVVGFILVFCDLASNINIMKNILIASNASEKVEQDVEVVKKVEF